MTQMLLHVSLHPPLAHTHLVRIPPQLYAYQIQIIRNYEFLPRVFVHERQHRIRGTYHQSERRL